MFPEIHSSKNPAILPMIEKSQIPKAADDAEAESPIGSALPSNWTQALAALSSSRAAILKIEGKKVASDLIVKVGLVIIAVLGLLFSWILLMIGLVGVLTVYTILNWWQASFAIAGGHVVIAIVLLLIAKAIGSEPFPVTRKEFEKDREWLNQLKQQSKSQS